MGKAIEYRIIIKMVPDSGYDPLKHGYEPCVVTRQIRDKICRSLKGDPISFKSYIFGMLNELKYLEEELLIHRCRRR